MIFLYLCVLHFFYCYLGMKRVLVTGAAGYIGSHTVVELVEAGYDVVGVDNFSNSSESVWGNVESIVGRKVDFCRVDCTVREELAKVFAQYDDIVAIVHLAAYKAPGESVSKPLDYYDNNLQSLLNIVELGCEYAERREAESCGAAGTSGHGAAANKVNIVFSSSAAVYGMAEKADFPIRETIPLRRATSPYGRSKQMCEDILQDCVAAYNNLNVIALRYFNPIGAHPSALIGELPNGVPNNLVPFITQTAAGIRECLSVFGDDYDTPDGSCIRDYIYVVDLAKAHVKAIGKMLEENVRWDVFNIGTGAGLSVLEIVKAFIEVTGVQLNYKIAGRREGDIVSSYANADKANRELGWSADTPIADVLLSAWKWQQNLMK